MVVLLLLAYIGDLHFITYCCSLLEKIQKLLFNTAFELQDFIDDKSFNTVSNCKIQLFVIELMFVIVF